MKKCISIILALLSVFIISLSVNAAADFEEDIRDKLFSSLDGDVQNTLKDFGITDLNPESIYSISFSEVFSYYRDTFVNLFSGSLRSFMKLLSVVLLVGFVSFVLENEKYKSLLSYVSLITVTLMITESINLCLNSAISLIRLNSNFMISFVPVYAVAIAASGNPTAALTYNSLIIALSEGISALINYGLIDIVGCFFCLCIAFSMNDVFNFARLLSFSNRLITLLLGFSASLFSSVLALKSVLSASADSVASKSVRFAIGSLIPVIGSSISDAYSVLLGSINVIKGSVALVGIIAILIMNIPVLTEIIFYYFSFSILSMVSELLDCKTLSNAFSGFSCGVKIIGLLAVLEMFVFIVSTAVMLSLKGG